MNDTFGIEITSFRPPFQGGPGGWPHPGLKPWAVLCSPSGGETDGPLSQRAWAVGGDDVHRERVPTMESASPVHVDTRSQQLDLGREREGSRQIPQNAAIASQRHLSGSPNRFGANPTANLEGLTENADIDLGEVICPLNQNLMNAMPGDDPGGG